MNLAYESLSAQLHERFPQLAEPKYTSLIGNIDADSEPFVLYGVVFNHYLKEVAIGKNPQLTENAAAFLEDMSTSSDSHVEFLLTTELLPTLVSDQSTIDSFWPFLGPMTRRQMSLLPPKFLRKIDLPISG
jgi:hypothetical protein